MQQYILFTSNWCVLKPLDHVLFGVSQEATHSSAVVFVVAVFKKSTDGIFCKTSFSHVSDSL